MTSRCNAKIFSVELPERVPRVFYSLAEAQAYSEQFPGVSRTLRAIRDGSVEGSMDWTAGHETPVFLTGCFAQ